jgi:hypothetical protein
MLIVQPCADPEIRLQFLDAVLQGFHRYSRHVCPEHWALMELLAADLGAFERVSASLPSPESVASPADDPLVELSRASVALYSLTESALRQVKRILEDRYPGVKVSLNSDFVGTARLWVGGSVGRWVGGSVGRWVGGSVGRWDGGSVGRWDGGTVGRWDGGTVGRWAVRRCVGGSVGR